MKPCLSEDEVRLAEVLGDTIYQAQAKGRIMDLAKSMDSEQSSKFLDGCQVSRLYKHVIHNQMVFVEDLQELSSLNSMDVTREIRSKQLECLVLHLDNNWSTKWDSDEIYGRYTTLSEDRLLFLLNILRALRKAIGVAAKSSTLEPDLLATLKMQLQVFDNDSLYSLACSMVAWKSPREPYLVRPNSEEWW